MPFAVLSFSATDTLRLGRFVLSCPQELKDFLEDTMQSEESNAAGQDDSEADLQSGGEDTYLSWNGNSCILSAGYYVDVHELLNKIEQNGWKIDQFSTSLTGSGVQCQTYVFSQQ